MARILARSKEGLGNMLKIEDKEAKTGYTWYFMSEAVESFVNGSKIVPGEDVDLTTEEIKGENTITRVSRIGGTTESKFKCKICGKDLKDNKYENCYDCNVKLKEQGLSSPEERTKQDSIQRQAMMKSAADAISRTIGTVTDVNVLYTKIEMLYSLMLNKINK